MLIRVNFPPIFEGFFFRPGIQYRIAFGGRGSGKSWSFARALLVRSIKESTRVVCVREYQNSIKDSVYSLLCDQIDLLGLSSYFTVFKTEIKCNNNSSLITFRGLSDITADSIKSFEGVDIAWIDEGQTISQRSLDIFLPTIIRKPGSEVWISLNPELETDPVYQYFIVNPPAGCLAVRVNYNDNPFFSKESEGLRKHNQATMSVEQYEHIWLGKCLPAVDGAVYFKQISEAQDQGRVRNVPYNPMLKVHLVCDIGFNDSTTFGMFQVVGSELRMIDYLEGNQMRWDEYNQLLRTRNYNWGRVWLPHDGFAKRIEADGQSSADILIKLGWDVAPRTEITQISIEEGIRVVRLKFHQLWIDKDKCQPCVEHLKRYRRHVSKTTNTATGPVHDEHSHAADMIRYFFINCQKMTNSDSRADFWSNNLQRAPRMMDAGIGY